ncbi:MAG: DUF2905 domain-containing protein [Armatimonadota bacterium]
MSGLGRTLILAGAFLVLLGLVVSAGAKLFGRHDGLLPGDIVYRRGNFTFYFPLATCVLLSVVLTLAMWLLTGLRR